MAVTPHDFALHEHQAAVRRLTTAAKAAGNVPSVLFADDPSGPREHLGALLSRSGFEVTFACSCRDAVAASQRVEPRVVVVELALPDGSGLDVIRTLRRMRSAARCIVITAGGSSKLAVESMRVGAVDFLEKPLSGAVLLQAVALAMNGTGRPDDSPLTVSVPHAISRWARIVTQVIPSPYDLPTLHAWGKHVAASTGTIRNWCYTAGFPAKPSLLFARVLRAVVRHQRDGLSPDNLLDVVDQRTLRKLLRLGGLTADKAQQLPLNVDDFLSRQQWIANDVALQVVRASVRAYVQ